MCKGAWGSLVVASSVKTTIHFGLNGRPVTLDADDGHMLLWALRTGLELTGTKYGCGEGLCGACTVIVDGRAVRSCITPLRQVAGKQVVTVEGLAKGGKLSPLQQASIDHGAFQCGYCTSGMLVEATAFLREHPKPAPQEIVARMERNLCRCGAHQRIIAAIESVARSTAGAS